MNQESVPSDLERLCPSCDTFPFGAAGFYESDFDADIQMSRQLLKLPEVLSKSEQCIFCRKIVGFFDEWQWRDQNFGNRGPDRQNASAALHMHLLDSKDYEGNPKGGLFHIRICLMIPNPSDELRSYSRVLQLQRCSQPLLKVEDFCNRTGSLCDWECGPEQAFTGRIRPLVAKTQLFRKWKETCCAIHSNNCGSIFTGQRSIFSLRLIDVEKRCIVDSENDIDYVALSYVWGEHQLSKCGELMPKLTKLTKNDFRKPGSLTSETLLSTIDDAIEVTKCLGEKLIWIDCLCIMQDDEVDKQKFIPKMDLIFGFASVTIVAASGVDADAGLPGIKPGSRTRKQEPFKIDGISFLQTLDPPRSEDKPSYLADSEWYKRGWTFQEKIFSRRALIFTPEQVYWECQKATWCEDGIWETMKPPTVYRHCFAEEDFRHPWHSDVDSFEKIYPKLVQEYSGRTLTYDSDGLNAFEGILNAVRKEARQDFLCALPTSFLSHALTWHRSKEFYKRRKETTTGCPFPSWSWVGWVGEVVWFGWWATNTKPPLDLIFYYLDANRSLREVKATGATESLSQISVRKDGDRTDVTCKDIPEIVLSSSIASNILFFWSSTAKLLVKHGKHPYQPIICHNGKVGTLKWTIEPFWIHSPSLPPDHEDQAEFVVIGKCAPEGHLAVLLLSPEDKDGVVYRQGLLYIVLSDWVKLDLKWKMISLG